MFERVDIAFDAGIFANRSKKASVNRWVDGDFVRFPDGPPQQIGGWRTLAMGGASIEGMARAAIAWRSLDQLTRYFAVGTHTGLYRCTGSTVTDITPTGFSPGSQNSVVGNGFGLGPFGMGTFGTPRASVLPSVIDAATWTADMFGSVLIACYTTDGTIYKYDDAVDSEAVAVSTAPTARAICVSDERHLFALGCDGDEKLVLWSNREDYTDFDLTTPGTRAGSFDMNNTSRFQCAQRCRGMVLAWTRTEAFAFAPLGNAAVYSRERLATNCGIAGPHAVAIVTSEDSEMALWMGEQSFFIFDGLVRELPCELRDHVFGDINLVQRIKFHAHPVAQAGEVWFHYSSAGSDECDRAVIYCYRNNSWSKASISRLTGMDRGIFSYPMLVGADGALIEHEYGDTADGEPIGGFVTSHPLQLGTARRRLEIDAFWPDLQEGSGECALTLACTDFPGGDPYLFGPYDFDVATEKLDLNVDARFVQVTIEGAAGHWELGLPAASIQEGGER